ncbi:MAG: GIY-YIG nuclease family protein [Oligoflexales bacterium]|nr:GIY-YIG nuclease family protein [Oligoflexales bacterium]
MQKGAYIYILASNHNSLIYIGVTNNLSRRLSEHCSMVFPG